MHIIFNYRKCGNFIELEMDYSIQIPAIGLYDVCQFIIILESPSYDVGIGSLEILQSEDPPVAHLAFWEDWAHEVYL